MSKDDGFVRYTVRIPAGLYQQISNAADAQGRSVNAEIINRLDRSVIETHLERRDSEMIRLLSARVEALEGVIKGIQSALAPTRR